MTLQELNTLAEDQAEAVFRNCCNADTWVEGMVDHRPYTSQAEIFEASQALWPLLSEADWLQAFEAHPRIGDIETLRNKYAQTRALASNEQAAAKEAPEALLTRLKALNDAYLEKFGFIFIVCATGKSAADMLQLLEQRLPNTRSRELEIAAREQARITELRLEKLL